MQKERIRLNDMCCHGVMLDVVFAFPEETTGFFIDVFASMMQPDPSAAAADVIAQFVCDHIKAWDIVDKSGSPLLVCKESVRLLPQRNLVEFIKFLFGMRGEDEGNDVHTRRTLDRVRNDKSVMWPEAVPRSLGGAPAGSGLVFNGRNWEQR